MRGSSRNSEEDHRSQQLNLTLESKSESPNVAEWRITRFAQRAGFGEQQCEEIGLSLREAVINAILHGNRYDLGKQVCVTAELRADCLVICVTDEGEGFDPDSLPDPLSPQNLMRESGRGLFLMKLYMDEVVLRRNDPRGMELVMTKYFADAKKSS